MRQYECYEMKLHGPVPDDHVKADVWGTFELNGKETRVKGFYAGENTYIVRYLPMEAGVCRYHISGAVQAESEENCEPAVSGKHGMVRAEGTHFRYEDGTWFYPFGTTVYALIHQEDSLMEQTFETLEKAPFNKIRICVFPKHYDYNHNEPSYFPFEKKDGKWDVNSPSFTFWDRLESSVRKLDDMGIQCDLILFHPYDHWGFSELSKEEALVYLEYVTRRLSAFPNIWWSLANEYDLMEYSMEEWKEFAHFLHENDNYRHLLSNHQIVTPWDYANPDTTHICHQTGAIEKVAEWIDTYQKPLMIDETGYEGNIPFDWGNLSAFELVNKFWTVCVQGGYCTHGETFLNEEEVLWWSKGGTLKGESPARIRFLKEIIESLPCPLSYRGEIITEERFNVMKGQMTPEQKKQPFTRMLSRLPWDAAQSVLMAGRELEGCAGEAVYLKYYGRHCTSVGTMKLPENGNYTIEVIDVWEMSRKTVMEDAAGKVKFSLPGKEGIAVLAVRKTE